MKEPAVRPKPPQRHAAHNILGNVVIDLQPGIGEEPLSRMVTPEDTANVVAFLASRKASYITGATVTMDGGMVPVVV